MSIDDIESAAPGELAEFQKILAKSEPEQAEKIVMELVVDNNNSTEHGTEYYIGIRRAVYAMRAFVGTSEIASRMDKYAKWMWLNQMVTARKSQLEREQAVLDLPF